MQSYRNVCHYHHIKMNAVIPKRGSSSFRKGYPSIQERMSLNNAESHSDREIIYHRKTIDARQNTTIAAAMVIVSCIFHSVMRSFALPFRTSGLCPAIRFYPLSPIETDGASERIIIIISKKYLIVFPLMPVIRL